MPFESSHIIGAILMLGGVGLAAVSAWTHVKTNGSNGEGWAIIAVLLLLSSCNTL